jgi:hypothetical protein
VERENCTDSAPTVNMGGGGVRHSFGCTQQRLELKIAFTRYVSWILQVGLLMYQHMEVYKILLQSRSHMTNL